jgi:hypothetical protein
LVLEVACGGSILLGGNTGSEPPDSGGTPYSEDGFTSASDGAVISVTEPDGGVTEADGGVGALGEAGTGLGQDASADACPNSQFDPHNCGTCGHDCMGGACQEGTCVPLPPGVLASGQASPTSIVVDDTNVYWINNGLLTSPATLPNPVTGQPAPVVPAYGPLQIMKCAKTGCNNNPTVVFSSEGLAAYANGGGDATWMAGLATDGKNVYWLGHHGLAQCTIQGCKLPYGLNPGSDSSVISVDSKNVYMCGGCGNGCCANAFIGPNSPVGAQPVRSLLWPDLPDSSFQSGLGIVVDGVNAYSVDSVGTAVSCPLSGCSVPKLLGTSPYIPFLETAFFAIDETSIYWDRGNAPNQGTIDIPLTSANGQLLQCAKAGCTNGPTVLASGLGNPMALTSDGSNVYFAELGTSMTSGATDGRIAKCAVTGCSNGPTTVAHHLGYPHGVAVDASHVYWTDFGTAALVNITPGHYSLPQQSADGRIMIAAK